MLDELTNILTREVVFYKELISLMQEEKRVLCTRRRGAELHKLAAGMETLVFKIKGLGDSRSDVAKRIVASYGLNGKQLPPSGDVNLSQIIMAVDEPYKARFKDFKSRLSALAESIKELNMANGIVINRSIENIKTAFLFLKEITIPETYQPSGRMNSSL